MGKWLLFIFLAVSGLAVAADKGGSDSGEPGSSAEQAVIAEVREGDFVYRLVSEKGAYRRGESTVVYAELEYVGKAPAVDIYHAASPFYFTFREETRDYEVGYWMNLPLIQTTLKRGEPIREAYRGGGGFSDEDAPAYIAFLQEIWKRGFPKGSYVFDGSAEFYVEAADGKRTDYALKGQIRFRVKP